TMPCLTTPLPPAAVHDADGSNSVTEITAGGIALSGIPTTVPVLRSDRSHTNIPATSIWAAIATCPTADGCNPSAVVAPLITAPIACWPRLTAHSRLFRLDSTASATSNHPANG